MIDRYRRLRSSDAMREMLCEIRLSPSDLMMPFFVTDGRGVTEEINTMPGVYRYSVDTLIGKLKEVTDAGIRSVLLFGVPDPRKKNAAGTEACNPDGAVQRAVAAVKQQYPALLVAADICLCEYTSHGHCGLIEGEKVLNDQTLPVLARAALSCAAAGADIIAPSDMMDGRVSAIRRALDDGGFSEIPILAYSAKYASGFYGPFREAAGSAPSFGDRRSYQMDYRNSSQARMEVLADINEGADMVMVKPALSYLDIVRDIRILTDKPLFAYNVSGEYAMVKAASAAGFIEEKKVTMEILTAIKRAGADVIITYHALAAAGWINEGVY